MRRVGFSTGAVARGDFETALGKLLASGVKVVELSALRLEELDPLVDALPNLNLTAFEFVSFHAPSRFTPNYEKHVLEQLSRVAKLSIPIVVHPNVMVTPQSWKRLGSLLLIENMDKRTTVGQTARDLGVLFKIFPAAKLCCDLGHARQVDPTMSEARMILERFKDRIAEIHLSDVNTSSRHDPLSTYAMTAFRSVSALIPESTPIILETLIDEGQSDIHSEMSRAHTALESPLQAVAQ
jgi:hypothetical protein